MLIQCEAPATKLNGWSRDVGGQSFVISKPFVNASPAEIWLLLMRRERWIFYDRGVILTLMHWLGPSYFTAVIRTRAATDTAVHCPIEMVNLLLPEIQNYKSPCNIASDEGTSAS